MARSREKDKFLENHTSVFHYRDRTYAVSISPARIMDLNGKQRDYYPSTTEELVEDALRKLALDQQKGFFDKLATAAASSSRYDALRREGGPRPVAPRRSNCISALARAIESVGQRPSFPAGLSQNSVLSRMYLRTVANER